MKVGEYYFHKFNKYVEKITKIGSTIELISVNGVTSKIKLENFSDNYVKCGSIYEYKTTIEKAFSHGHIDYFADGVRVDIDDERITFSLEDDMLKVEMTDEVRDALNLEYNITYFYIKDVFEVINTIASLFED